MNLTTTRRKLQYILNESYYDKNVNEQAGIISGHYKEKIRVHTDKHQYI